MSSIENVKVELLRVADKHDDMAANVGKIPAAADKVTARIGHLAAQLAAIQAEILTIKEWPETRAINELSAAAAKDAREAHEIALKTLGIAWNRNVKDLPSHIAEITEHLASFANQGSIIADNVLEDVELPLRASLRVFTDTQEETRLLAASHSTMIQSDAAITRTLVEQYIAEL